MEAAGENVNGTPNLAVSIINDSLSFLSSYGWIILFIVIVASVAYSEFHPKWERWREKLEDQRKEADLKKNPEKAIAIVQAREMAIQRMQHSYNSDVEKYNEKMAKKEREKREQILAEPNRPQVLGSDPRHQSQSQSPSSSSNSCSKPRLRNNDYNPLSGGGGGGGGSYRPRRSGPSGG